MNQAKYVLRAKDFNPYVLYFKRWSPDGQLANWTRTADLAYSFATREAADAYQVEHDLKETTAIVLLPEYPLVAL